MISKFIAKKSSLISIAILIIFTAISFMAPLFESWLGIDSSNINLFDRLSSPSTEHWLGTDELGRDVFIRLLYGGQISLTVGLLTALIAAIIGTIIGLIAGFYGGWIDSLLMRTTDSIIALPLLPLLIILAAIDLDKLGIPSSITDSDNMSLYRIIAIIALFGWTTVARLVRANVLSVREHTYVIAAKALGSSNRHIIWSHILPNVSAPIIVATTLSIGNIILLESVLSFLGLGIQPPIPSWGSMLTNAQDLIWDQPLLTLYPGLMIFITVIAFNFLGDKLQDALNPKTMEGNK